MTTITLTQTQIQQVLDEHCDSTEPPPTDPPPTDPPPIDPEVPNPLTPVPRPVNLPSDVDYYNCTTLFGRELAVSKYLSNGNQNFTVHASKFMLGFTLPELSKSELMLVTQRATGTGPYKYILSHMSDMDEGDALITNTFSAGSIGHTFDAGEPRVVYLSLEQTSGEQPLILNLELMLR